MVERNVDCLNVWEKISFEENNKTETQWYYLTESENCVLPHRPPGPYKTGIRSIQDTRHYEVGYSVWIENNVKIKT